MLKIMIFATVRNSCSLDHKSVDRMDLIISGILHKKLIFLQYNTSSKLKQSLKSNYMKIKGVIPKIVISYWRKTATEI